MRENTKVVPFRMRREDVPLLRRVARKFGARSTSWLMRDLAEQVAHQNWSNARGLVDRLELALTPDQLPGFAVEGVRAVQVGRSVRKKGGKPCRDT
jgi:hypothetical protein